VRRGDTPDQVGCQELHDERDQIGHDDPPLSFDQTSSSKPNSGIAALKRTSAQNFKFGAMQKLTFSFSLLEFRPENPCETRDNRLAFGVMTSSQGGSQPCVNRCADMLI
jgi:hypothetical protein